ncbi:PKD domain-containing protein [Candidatus Bipolaricaulota bacterium]
MRRRIVPVSALVVLLLGLAGCLQECPGPWMVTIAPRASFTFSPEGGRAPLDVYFDGSSSSDSDGYIEDYLWRFGDGEMASAVGIEHAYELPGNYTVILQVTDDKNAKDSASQEIQVTQAPEIYASAVVADEVCTPGNVCCEPGEAIGAPDVPSRYTLESFVSLGSGEGLIVAFMDEAFTDGPGPDLRVYEVGHLHGGVDEAFNVYISADAGSWLPVANAVKNDPGRTFASIDISQYPGEFRFVVDVEAG